MIKNQSEIVRRGYDRLSFVYRSDETPDDYEQYAEWIDMLAERVPEGSPVLDLGCGCGLPATRLLARRYDVTGVDFSSVQIERARKLVPDARLVCADVVGLDLPAAAFDAVVSFYAIIHMPLAAHAPLYRDVARWLRPGGVFLAIVGHEEWTGTDEQYLDVEEGLMAWSHADEATNVRWIEEAGFRVEWTRFVPEGDVGHTLVLARKPD